MIKKSTLGLVLISSGAAHAGGMMLPIRGVHDTMRAGALVAGTEDADSIFLNPAGLAHQREGSELVVDGAYVNQSVDYARIDSGDNQLAGVSNQYPGITIPTVAYARALGTKGLVLGAGLTAPYAGLHRYDASDTAAERYSSISLAESAFAMASVGVAYAPSESLRIGVAVTDTIALLKSQVDLSGCPGQTICAPEDPEFDARTRLNVHDFFAPSISAGVQWEPDPHVTLAAMAQSPTWIDASGTVDTKLPSSAYFEGAMVVGNGIDVKFELPPVTRFGVEVRPNENLHVELALDIEYWSVHEEMRLTTHDVHIDNGAGVGEYDLSPLTIPRHYKNSYAPALGVEYDLGQVQVGAGYSYETAAAPKGYVSVLTVDSAKHIIGLGGSFKPRGGWTLGGAFAFVKLTDVDVALADAKVPQLTPLRDQPSEVMVNAGSYKSSYIVGGLRLAKKF